MVSRQKILRHFVNWLALFRDKKFRIGDTQFSMDYEKQYVYNLY